MPSPVALAHIRMIFDAEIAISVGHIVAFELKTASIQEVEAGCAGYATFLIQQIDHVSLIQ